MTEIAELRDLSQPVIPYKRFLMSVFTENAISSAFLTNFVVGTPDLIPIEVPRRMRFDRMFIAIGVAAGNMEFGIYRDNGGTPVGGALLLDTGDIVTVAPVTTATINITLNKGLYWLAFQCSSAVATYYRSSSAIQWMSGLLNTFSYTVVGYLPFPNPCPAVNNDATPRVYMGMRIAQVLE